MPLPEDITIRVFDGEMLIFSSAGKWLMPIFELEQFMETYTGPRTCLSAHDTAIGKAAAVMMIRLGISRMYANLTSDVALTYIARLNTVNNELNKNSHIQLLYDRKVPKLLCATEDMLAPLSDTDAMYLLLRQKAPRQFCQMNAN